MQLGNSKRWIENNRSDYNVQALSDGVVVMQRNANREAGRNLKLENALNQILATPLLDNTKRLFKP